MPMQAHFFLFPFFLYIQAHNLTVLVDAGSNSTSSFGIAADYLH